MSVGMRIKLLRIEMEMTKKDLSVLLGVTPTAIYNWEDNRKKFPVKMAQNFIKIAKGKGIELTLDQLYKEEE